MSTSKDKGQVNGQNFNQKLLEFTLQIVNVLFVNVLCLRKGSQAKLENGFVPFCVLFYKIYIFLHSSKYPKVRLFDIRLGWDLF